ncbi:hypothetical protein [Aliigemmobacter aestuarii]|nr:hypothetical protein [Gemmobacter aestuarii]
MSSVEIEDVLSSIRRLVSEDLRPQHRPQTPASSTPSAGADRLILTPALRVVGNEPAEAAPAPQGLQPVAAPVPEVGAELATPAAELPETFGHAEPEPAPEAMSEAMSEAAADPAWWSDEVAFADMAAPSEPAHFDDPAQSTESSQAAEPAQSAEPDAASVIEDVVAGLSQQDYDASWEPETGDPMDDHPALHWADGAWAEPTPRMPAFDRIDEAEEAELAARDQVGEPVHAWAEGDWDATVTSGDEALQAGSFADPTPDVVPDPAPADAAMADRAEAEAIAAIAAMEVVDDLEQATMARLAEEAADAEAEVGLFDAEDGVMDEEALREVVRDIIRDELQGSLGERITRNVRKLVRAEVARALAAREFD